MQKKDKNSRDHSTKILRGFWYYCGGFNLLPPEAPAKDEEVEVETGKELWVPRETGFTGVPVTKL